MRKKRIEKSVKRFAKRYEELNGHPLRASDAGAVGTAPTAVAPDLPEIERIAASADVTGAADADAARRAHEDAVAAIASNPNARDPDLGGRIPAETPPAAPSFDGLAHAAAMGVFHDRFPGAAAVDAACPPPPPRHTPASLHLDAMAVVNAALHPRK
jgi:hypothetical protein